MVGAVGKTRTLETLIEGFDRLVRDMSCCLSRVEKRDDPPRFFCRQGCLSPSPHSLPQRSTCESYQNSSQGCYFENMISRMVLRNVSPSTWESGNGSEPLEIGRFREWN